ncbi:oogenesis-related [Gouania willdenowi]|uniref:oogenesis-related n=1 Tax=Gouania willdenowi TaxID=441366 RepID=UPI0010551461|nr:uncharacterized protein LOC114462481 [Gouania willdenowi]
MSCVVPEEIVEHGRENNTEDGEVRISKAGLVYNILLWPFSVVVRAYRGVWMLLGFPPQAAMVSPATAATPARHSLSGRKRIGPFTRLLLYVLPRWVQRILGYPVPSSIGCSLSPEIRVSPTKPHGKGSKRKQDDLYEEDDDDEEPPTWVEVLNQDLQEEGPDLDPDYEPSTMDTESEEYRSHNSTESDLEVTDKGVVIQDVAVQDADTEVVQS